MSRVSRSASDSVPVEAEVAAAAVVTPDPRLSPDDSWNVPVRRPRARHRRSARCPRPGGVAKAAASPAKGRPTPRSSRRSVTCCGVPVSPLAAGGAVVASARWDSWRRPSVGHRLPVGGGGLGGGGLGGAGPVGRGDYLCTIPVDGKTLGRVRRGGGGR